MTARTPHPPTDCDTDAHRGPAGPTAGSDDPAREVTP
jgi:hypothetical protein